MITLLTALLLGPLDAARGGKWKRLSPSVFGLLYGAAIALLLGVQGWMILVVAIAFRLGESMGWGCPLGAALRGQPMNHLTCWSGLERWQVGPLRTNAWLALAARGALWGLPIGLLGVVDARLAIMPAVMALAMVAAPALVRASIGWRPAEHLWALQEFVRGWLVGGVLLAVWVWA